MKKIFLTVALCLGVAGLYAQTGSIERVLKSIEQNNRELRAGEEAVRAAIEKDRQSVKKAKEAWRQASGKAASESTFRSFLSALAQDIDV